MLVRTIQDFMDISTWHGPSFDEGPVEVDDEKGKAWVDAKLAEYVGEGEGTFGPSAPPPTGVTLNAAHNLRETMSTEVAAPGESDAVTEEEVAALEGPEPVEATVPKGGRKK